MEQPISNQTASLAVFLFAYFLIAVRRTRLIPLHRPAAALLGAVLMVLATDLTMEGAYALIDWNTISLLLGMMVIVAYLRTAGFFDWAAHRLLAMAHRPRLMLYVVVFACGLFSALFVNDTICLIFTPVVLLVVARWGLNPVPFLLAVATGSNLGSVITFTGNPQNMLIGIELSHRHPEWTYLRFVVHMLPIAILSMLACGWIIARIYRKDLADRPKPADYPQPPNVDQRLMRRGLLVLAGTLLGFAIWPAHMPLAALTGSIAMMLLSGRPARPVVDRNVDWPLLLFFAGLFVIVGGVRSSGVIEAIHLRVAPLLAGTAWREVGVFSAFTAIGSNLLSNVPYVAVAGTWVESFSNPGLGWVTLAMASTFAGNLTIFGSVANLIVLEISHEKAPISFWEYCRVGVPVTLVSTAIGVAILLLYHVLGG